MLGRLVLYQILLLLCQSVLYFGCERYQKNFHNVERPIDKYIPFIPFTSLFYCMWFPLIALFPISLFYADSVMYYLYMRSMLCEIIISVFCYMIYPTTFERPVPPDTFWGRIMKLVYKGSYRGLNCAPSLHCSSCFLITYMACVCLGMPFLLRIIVITISTLIVVSTMTTKQHTIIDVITAVPVFAVSILVNMIGA